jgi:hypothetical protein
MSFVVRRGSCVFVALAIGLSCRSVEAQTASDEIVLRTATVSPIEIQGNWVRIADPGAAGGAALSNPDRSQARVAPALASPSNYFEMRFSARRGIAYHLWVRMRAEGNSKSGDSVHVQFSDAVNSLNQPIIRIGSTSSAELVLQSGESGSPPHGWGWTDNGWGALGSPIYFAADGAHVIRIQQREDGAVIDQIVLSPATFATTPPGPRRNDARILSAAGGLGPVLSAATFVIRPANAAAGRMYGTWQSINDASAAGGRALRNPDAAAGAIAPALSNPPSYFEASFTAAAGGPYHVWLRMRADGNSLSNDSAHVQFSDSTTSGGSPTARIGTTSSLEATLQAGPNGAAPQGWGWTDNGSGAPGAHVYFATSGTHTIRVQPREDGVAIDQIVISRDTYLTTSAGWRHNDQTILPGSALPVANQPPSVSLSAPASGATFTAPATMTMTATASDPENRLARVEFFNGSTRLATDTTAPYSYTWSGVPAGSYQLRATAFDADGGSTSSSIASVTVGTSSNQPPTVSLTAPSSGATFAAPASITMTATAADPENRLARVEFFNGSTRLATDSAAPFSYTWTGVAAGSYQLQAIAFDADGRSASSSTATVTVGSTSSLTRRVAFTASADHATVTRYVMDVYLSTAVIGVTLPLTSSDLGKPAPNSSNEIIVDRTTLLNSLLPGIYRITVSAVGAGGSSRSAPYSFTR